VNSKEAPLLSIYNTKFASSKCPNLVMMRPSGKGNWSVRAKWSKPKHEENTYSLRRLNSSIIQKWMGLFIKDNAVISVLQVLHLWTTKWQKKKNVVFRASSSFSRNYYW